jgi:hypothetical protein
MVINPGFPERNKSNGLFGLGPEFQLRGLDSVLFQIRLSLIFDKDT